MPLDPAIVGRTFPPVSRSFSEKDVLLYALSVGYGSDPLDEDELRFAAGTPPRVPPTFAVTLGHVSIRTLDLGIDYGRVVHGTQDLALHASLPPAGEVVATTRVADLADLGREKGARLTLQRDIRDGTGRHLATATMTAICRGDGGFGGAPPPASSRQPEPDRPPDFTVDIPISPSAALLYRLNGDDNPLHVSPEAAKRAGFPRPILHGLGTLGFVERSLLKLFGGYDPGTLGLLGARFSAPVYPGDVLRLGCWRERGEVHYRASVPDRAVVVMTGRAVFRSG